MSEDEKARILMDAVEGLSAAKADLAMLKAKIERVRLIYREVGESLDMRGSELPKVVDGVVVDRFHARLPRGYARELLSHDQLAVVLVEYEAAASRVNACQRKLVEFGFGNLA
jgi:hypothetical protein